MAIDWGRMAKGVATGYLGAKIANTEANDKLNANIIEAAGLRFHEKTYPEWEAKEKLYNKDFKMVESIHGKKVANYFADKDLFGTGNGLADVESILKKYNINKEELNKLDLSTFEERKASRLEDIQSKERQIMELTTGSSKIGPMTAKNQLEGFGEGIGAATETQPSNIEGTPIVPVQPDISKSVSADMPESIFTQKADERGVESKYAHVERAIEAQHGYAQTHEIGADGQVTFTWGPKRKIAAAHVQFATMLLEKNPNLDQNTAASAAKRYLVFYTEKPFADLNSINELKDTSYEQGDETNRAVYKGKGFVAGKIDINSTQYKGMPIKNYILDKIDNLPKTRDGNINEAIFQKFVENVPENLMDGDITFRASLLAQRQTQELVNNYFALK